MNVGELPNVREGRMLYLKFRDILRFTGNRVESRCELAATIWCKTTLLRHACLAACSQKQKDRLWKPTRWIA